MTIQTGTDIGRYHILEQLGEGGMAVVYKAYDTRLENEVALKVIRTDEIGAKYLPRLQKRFRTEAKKMAQLTHPNIVKVMDYGEHDDAPFLVMPFLEGGTLKEQIGQPIAVNEIAEMVLPIADALGYAHEKGLVHRDIKPSNILITESGKPMLSDFGVAKILDDEETRDLTMTGMGVGTPEYMAPEMGMSMDFDHRADIYALGIVLYEMVTGRKPFIADTPIAVLFKHSSDPLPRPTQFNADIPEEFERVLFKALAKDPDARYQTMEALAGALKTFAGESRAAVKTAPAKPSRTPERIVPEEAPQEEKKQAREKKPFDARWLYGALGVLGLGLIIFAGMKIVSETEPEAEPGFEEEVMEATTGTVEEQADPSFSKIDGMTLVYVPAGEFMMGSEDGGSDESPVHSVYLDAYYIDQTEVTNAQYKLCVQAGDCDQPSDTQNYNNSSYADHPVVYVSWNDANDYCKWAGRQLPTEAQWEKAARGTDGRTYPWGNSFDSSLANVDDETIIDDYTVTCTSNGCDGYDRTAPVGSFPVGSSPYGALDMAGNVWEWVADWYDEDYYENSTGSNPSGPGSGDNRVLRGGSWFNNEGPARSANRYNYSPLDTNDDYGFRCARLP